MRNQTLPGGGATLPVETGEQRYRQQEPLYIPLFAACGSLYLCFFGYQDFLLNPPSVIPRLPILFVLLLVSVRGVMQWFRIRRHNFLATEERNREIAGSAPGASP